jgi:hypothetical protein
MIFTHPRPLNNPGSDVNLGNVQHKVTIRRIIFNPSMFLQVCGKQELKLKKSSLPESFTLEKNYGVNLKFKVTILILPF